MGPFCLGGWDKAAGLESIRGQAGKDMVGRRGSIVQAEKWNNTMWENYQPSALLEPKIKGQGGMERKAGGDRSGRAYHTMQRN